HAVLRSCSRRARWWTCPLCSSPRSSALCATLSSSWYLAFYLCISQYFRGLSPLPFSVRRLSKHRSPSNYLSISLHVLCLSLSLSHAFSLTLLLTPLSLSLSVSPPLLC